MVKLRKVCQQLVLLLAIFNLTQTQLCTSPCDTCLNSFDIISVDYTGQDDGVYFNFDKLVIDDILQRENWNLETFTVVYSDTNYTGSIILFDSVNGASGGATGSGTLSASDPITATQGYFVVGATITFVVEQKCLSCTGQMTNKEAAPACTCSTGYVFDDNFNCKIECSHQCETCEFQETKCLTCKDPDVLAPDCLFPSRGYIMVNTQGVISYEQCASYCADCEVSVDVCTECVGEGKLLENNCGCEAGFFNKNNECQACGTLCETCNNAYSCTTCKPEHERELNPYNGKCVCKKGFIAVDGMECLKCFMLGDQCFLQCPKNTVADEENHLCITQSYSLKSHLILIYVCAGLSIMVQIVTIAILKNKLIKHLNAMKMERDMLIGAGKLSSKGTFVSPSKKGDAENPDLRMSIASFNALDTNNNLLQQTQRTENTNRLEVNPLPLKDEEPPVKPNKRPRMLNKKKNKNRFEITEDTGLAMFGGASVADMLGGGKKSGDRSPKVKELDADRIKIGSRGNDQDGLSPMQTNQRLVSTDLQAEDSPKKPVKANKRQRSNLLKKAFVSKVEDAIEQVEEQNEAAADDGASPRKAGGKKKKKGLRKKKTMNLDDPVDLEDIPEGDEN